MRLLGKQGRNVLEKSKAAADIATAKSAVSTLSQAGMEWKFLLRMYTQIKVLL